MRTRAAKFVVKHWAFAISIVWAVSCAAISATSVGEFIDANVTRPFFFHARELVHRDPDLDPKLKILSYDDGSVDRLQRPDLTIDDWATVLKALSLQKPRMILIDKVFGIIFDPLGKKEEAIKTLETLETPVIVGAFATEEEIKTRPLLDLERPYYSSDAEVVVEDNTYKSWHVYGPNKALAQAFAGAGSLLYYDNGVVNAFLNPIPRTVVPHIAMFAAKTRTFEGGRMVIDGARLPVNAKGQVVVNFSRQAKYYDRHRRLGTAVQAARDGAHIKGIEEGDTVLILPEMFTGSTDFKFTPLGIMPGGFILASMINSVLTGGWLQPLPGKEVLVLLLALLGAFWGHHVTSLRYWGGLVTVTVLMAAVSVYAFAYQAVIVSAIIPLFSFWGTSLVMFAERTRAREKEASRIRDEMNDAAEMAKAFRPDDVPVWEGLEIAAYHRSFTEASGDWYAFRTSPSGRFRHFIMCDITGHGVQAALVVSICKTMLVIMGKSMLTAKLPAPSDADAARLDDADFLLNFSRELNNMLFYHGRGQHLVTMLGFTFDRETNQVIYVSAGHPAPMLCTTGADGARKFATIAVRSTVLGLTDSVDLKPKVQALSSGDELVAYTDGLPVGRHVRTVASFFKDKKYAFNSAPKALLDTVWSSEYQKTGKTIDDDVSIVWFKAA